jgi:hypothetical protein
VSSQVHATSRNALSGRIWTMPDTDSVPGLCQHVHQPHTKAVPSELRTHPLDTPSAQMTREETHQATLKTGLLLLGPQKSHPDSRKRPLRLRTIVTLISWTHRYPLLCPAASPWQCWGRSHPCFGPAHAQGRHAWSPKLLITDLSRCKGLPKSVAPLRSSSVSPEQE